jgi:hypothetical protein
MLRSGVVRVSKDEAYSLSPFETRTSRALLRVRACGAA